MSIEADYLTWLAEQKIEYPSVFRVEQVAGWVGIGDDAAVIPTNTRTVCCADLVAEGTHFLLTDEQSLKLAGRKALAVNLSDMAAMGAEPTDAILSLLVNRRNGLHQAKLITQGLLELAQEFEIQLIGGDTCTSENGVVINVTLLGKLKHTAPILRSGAEPGDVIVTTGKFGGSIFGKHLEFQPRLREIQQILQRVRLTSLTDVTDGLARDLHSILKSSHVGATIVAERIPIALDVKQYAAATQTLDSIGPEAFSNYPGLHHALNDGEDFELLMTMSPNQWDTLSQCVVEEKIRLECELSDIGVVEAGSHLDIKIGETVYPLPPGGYDH